MLEDYRDPDFKKWLDRLQQESWQLELIVSGFLIYALFSAYGPVNDLAQKAVIQENIYDIFIYLLVDIAVTVLIINLCVHLVLRGLWIGAIGLRYVSGEIDYEKFNYQEKFKLYLERKVGDFDKYIAVLERYSSVMFAFTFLMIFFMVSIFLIIGLWLLTDTLITLLAGEGIIEKVLLFMNNLFFIVGTAFLFLDFISLGGLKRSKMMAKVYFPFYKVFSYLSLSMVYRSMIYNLIDTRFGKRMVVSVLPVYVFFALVSSLEYRSSEYLSFALKEINLGFQYSSDVASASKYLDELGDEVYVVEGAVQSKIIEDEYLHLFIPFHRKIEEGLKESCNGILSQGGRRGLFSKIISFKSFNEKQYEREIKEYLNCFKEKFEVVIDQKIHTTSFVISTNGFQQFGFEGVLDLAGLERGKHELSLRPVENKEEVMLKIPFWYYP